MTSNAIFRTSLIWGTAAAVAIAIVGGVVGFIVDGSVGLTSALIGTAMSLVFLGITAGSILFANRFYKTDLYVPIFFGVVMGGWILKFVVFLILALVLRDQPWINPLIMFLCVIAGIVVTLVIDAVIVSKARLPYVSDVKLPGDEG